MCMIGMLRENDFEGIMADILAKCNHTSPTVVQINDSTSCWCPSGLVLMIILLVVLTIDIILLGYQIEKLKATHPKATHPKATKPKLTTVETIAPEAIRDLKETMYMAMVEK